MLSSLMLALMCLAGCAAETSAAPAKAPAPGPTEQAAQTSDPIDFSMTLGEITAREEFAPVRDFLVQPDAVRDMTTAQLCRHTSYWLRRDVEEGLDFLSERLMEGARSIYLGGASMIYIPPREGDKWVMLCPGGGYTMVALVGCGLPVARRLYELGYGVFLLSYRVGAQARCPNTIDDLAAGVEYALSHAQELGLKKDYILMGFSAGGHTAACFCTQSVGYRSYGLPGPGALVLAYPLVTMGELTHAASYKNFFGTDDAGAELEQKYSAELNVTPEFPPTYIWHFKEDGSVDTRNSGMMKSALDAAGVPCREEIFPGKGHGAGLATGTTAQGWAEAALEFCEGNMRG